ncbi:cytochrome P450 [Chaetomium fimeti]|uniref:Cytochrome P450 n=1 Tax=Chaetomium fimeti TaxID=1854472 RepID=A0AAE0LTX5_9PEZI|nr:cytochrome P450 [Chaetomium fimeti]
MGVTQYLLATLALLLAYSLGTYLTSPLRQYPGPFLAKFTNLWRIYHITQGNFQHVLVRLHEKYGPVVRIGPNVLDVDDPTLIKTVFSTKGNWKKTGYYSSGSPFIDGKVVHNIFTQDDEEKHAADKKPIAKYYSPAAVASLEPLINETITQLCSELDKRFVATSDATGKGFDLGKWILYYAWDVVGNVTFSQPFGYLSTGTDFDGTLRAAEELVDYFSWVGCMPFLDRMLEKNRVVQLFKRPGGFTALGATCVGRLIARYQGADASSRESKGSNTPAQPDYLDRFIEAKTADPTITDTQMVGWVMINMGAGADTTAISIRSALYYTLRTPGAWARLRAELADAGLTPPPAADSEHPSIVSLKQARRLPYLDAVVREAIRYLPGVSLGLERYVPAGGQRLPVPSQQHGPGSSETSVPQGTILAFNPYIINRNRGVWGADAHAFRPERWLRGEGESEDGFARRLRAMNDADLSFGAGSRMCVGKHVGLMQVYKVVATLALCYDIELVRPECEWTVVGSWFPRQEGLEVRMKRRGEGV